MQKNMSQQRKMIYTGLLVLMLLGAFSGISWAAPAMPIPQIQIGVGEAQGPAEVAQSLQLLIILTVLSLAPAILIMTTSFIRIVIVLSFTRTALGTNQMPPNQVMIGLALFLTFFTMAPTWAKVNDTALQPFLKGEIAQEAAFNQAMAPIRDFMFKQTRTKDLQLFIKASKIKRPANKDEIPTQVVIPAFIISELKTAFQIGFMIFIPFLIIDMIVASTLMSMGMMMLPPSLISLPFKILLFVMVDGWHLVVRSLITSFV
ncbi:MAG TPA: flagellar type III secretion system pore protein FliP [Bacillota bacterium]|nr:flagellar type III secretion system pore protein FliP [Bacillota bacterium]HPT87868.1 flagellar type III secretion system pore protein FliP [Bacillota bacterium]